MFALVAWGSRSLDSRQREPGQAPVARHLPGRPSGYHMNKTHWNTITLDGTIPAAELWGMIDDSYELVVQSLDTGPAGNAFVMSANCPASSRRGIPERRTARLSSSLE